MKIGMSSVLLIIVVLAAGVAAQSNTFYGRGVFLSGTPSSFNDGLAGFINPANLAFLDRWESRFYWSTENDKFGSFENWGFLPEVVSDSESSISISAITPLPIIHSVLDSEIRAELSACRTDGAPATMKSSEEKIS